MIGHFEHQAQLWRDFPSLVPGVLRVDGITPDVSVDGYVAAHSQVAAQRGGAESELPAIQAWRRAFGAMGLKPTQYRCASESLLRRFRKEGSLPRLHPLIDLCNAASLEYAIPVAVFDVSRIAGHVEVRYATGDEVYTTFGGEDEQPAPGEVVFADAAGRAHARRWTNRQSGHSAVRADTGSVLIVAEALHDDAPADVERLMSTLAAEVAAVWSVEAKAVILSASSPRVDF
jgi:DNA/RNA-binding domain of Phe-tRNA-synthetase-like protein